MVVSSLVGDVKIVSAISTFVLLHSLKCFFYRLSHASHLVVDCNLPIPVQRLPTPSGSMHSGDVSEMNGWDHVIRKSPAARNNEA